MARPIEHDFGSATVTTGWGAAKGGALGVLVSAVAGAVIFGGGLLAAGALLGGMYGGLVSGVTIGEAASAVVSTLTTGGAAILTGVVTLGGAVVGAMTGGTVTGIIGAIFGAAHGAHKVGAEKGAFRNKAMQAAGRGEMAQNNAAMTGIQQGYMAGFQEGQQYLLQQAQEQMLMAQAHEKQNSHAAKVDCKPCASKVEALAKQREAQTCAVNTVG